MEETRNSIHSLKKMIFQEISHCPLFFRVFRRISLRSRGARWLERTQTKPGHLGQGNSVAANAISLGKAGAVTEAGVVSPTNLSSNRSLPMECARRCQEATRRNLLGRQQRLQSQSSPHIFALEGCWRCARRPPSASLSQESVPGGTQWR